MTYINGENENGTEIKVKYSFTLKQIRDTCKDIIPKDDNYYFISGNGSIIKNEENYKASDVLKETGDKYRIDLKTQDIFDN